MRGLRYLDVCAKAFEFLDLTSLTGAEFDHLVPAFEHAFQEHMADWRLDGKRRTQRRYTTYQNCPLPTAHDRLLFVLVYLKNNPLQVLQGRLFGMPQNKASQWIHTLLPVVLATLRTLGDAPTRSIDALAQRFGASAGETADLPPLFAMMAPNDASRVPTIRLNRKASTAARKNAIR